MLIHNIWEVEAEVDELEALTTVQLREKYNKLGVVPVGDKRQQQQQQQQQHRPWRWVLLPLR
jgi:hypothetical protein